MTYKHLTIDELTMIESYYLQHNKPVEIANRMGRAIQTIYNVVNKFKQGKTALDYWHQYKENKKKCGRKVIQLPAHEVDYIKEKVTLGWTPDVIIGRKERPVSCGMRTLYRDFMNTRPYFKYRNNKLFILIIRSVRIVKRSD